jgi:hypothetical protein
VIEHAARRIHIHNQHRPHRALDAAAPRKPLPEAVDLEQYRAAEGSLALVA